MLTRRFSLLIGLAIAFAGPLAALKAAGLKGVAPAHAHGFSVLISSLTNNWVWLIVTGLGMILTIIAGLLIVGSRQAPDWLFKVIGGIIVVLVAIPAVLA
jgi:hypothetical protein